MKKRNFCQFAILLPTLDRVASSLQLFPCIKVTMVPRSLSSAYYYILRSTNTIPLRSSFLFSLFLLFCVSERWDGNDDNNVYPFCRNHPFLITIFAIFLNKQLDILCVSQQGNVHSNWGFFLLTDEMTTRTLALTNMSKDYRSMRKEMMERILTSTLHRIQYPEEHSAYYLYLRLTYFHRQSK